MNVLSTVLLSGSMIDLDPTLFVQAGIFFLTLGVLHVLVFAPMIRLFEAREEAIDGAKLEAQRLQSEAESASHSFDDQMRKVRRESQEERDRLRKDGQKLEGKLLETVERETEQLLSEAAARLVEEKAILRSELRARAPELAAQIAGKLLNREVR